MNIRNVLVIGGSGFIGSRIVAQLVTAGYRVTVPTRRRENARHLLLLPTIDVIEANVFDAATLRHLMQGQDAVINLVGVLHSPGGQPYGPAFARAHVELPRRIVAACQSCGVSRLLHISALHASLNAPSQYLRSKGAGEQIVRESGLQWTLFRPSVVFGPGDSFLNLFAGLCRAFPILPLAGAQARFQPVYVGDVAHAVVTALQRPDSIGQTYALAGPTVYTLAQLVAMVGRYSGHPRPILPLPGWAAELQAGLLELLPVKLMSRDNLRSMEVDSVANGAAQPFGQRPTALESIAPGYLRRGYPPHPQGKG